MALAMTTRIMLLSAVSIMFGASLAYGSPACMTISEARAKFPKTKHLYWHGSEHCWNDSAAYGFRALAVVPLASPRRAFAAVPRASTRPTPTSSPSPETLEPISMTEGQDRNVDSCPVSRQEGGEVCPHIRSDIDVKPTGCGSDGSYPLS